MSSRSSLFDLRAPTAWILREHRSSSRRASLRRGSEQIPPLGLATAHLSFRRARAGAPAAMPLAQQPTVLAATNFEPDAAREALAAGSLAKAMREEVLQRSSSHRTPYRASVRTA